MTTIVTELHDRFDRLERQRRRRHFADDLHARLDRLEHQLGGWHVGTRRPPSPAGFPGGLARGALMGGLVGASLALLLAPRDGRDTRARLQEAGEGLTARADALVGEVRAEVATLRASLPAGTDETAGRPRAAPPPAHGAADSAASRAAGTA